MARIIPLLTVIPTLFAFIAIILINVGGVGRPFQGGYANPKHRDLDLLTWNYTVSPASPSYYTVSIFLSRQCRGGQSFLSTEMGLPSSQQCPRTSTRTIRDSSTALTPNALLSRLRPFRFNQVHLEEPFALYIIAAICVFVAMLTGLGVACAGKRNTRTASIFGSAFSLLSFIFILVASALITWQTLRLANQVRNDTLETVSLRNTTRGASINDRIPYKIEILDVSIGRPVQGLTWAAVLATLIATVMWVVAAIQSPKPELLPPVEKEEQVSVSPSDRYVQSGV